MLSASARVIDVAPTLAWLAGTPLGALADMEGHALVDVLVPEARHVIGLLWDGCNSNSLYANPDLYYRAVFQLKRYGIAVNYRIIQNLELDLVGLLGIIHREIVSFGL